MNRLVIILVFAAFFSNAQKEENQAFEFEKRENNPYFNNPKYDDYFNQDGTLSDRDGSPVNVASLWLSLQITKLASYANVKFGSLQSQIDGLVKSMKRPVVSTIPNLEEVTTVGNTAKDDIIVPRALDAKGIHVGAGYWGGSDDNLSISADGGVYLGGSFHSIGKATIFGGLQVGSDLSAGEGRASDFYESIYIIGSGNKLDVDGNADIRGSTISLGNAGTGILTVESSTTFKKAISMNNKRIVSIATPEQGSDAATKSYVDSHFTNSITILVVSQSGNNIVLTPMRIKADAVLDQAFQTITLSSSQLLSDVRYVDGVNGSLRKTSMTALVINAASSNDVEIIATKEVQSVTP